MCVRAILAAGSGQTISADTLSGLQFGSYFILKLCWRQFLSHNAFVKPLQTLKSTFMSDFFFVLLLGKEGKMFFTTTFTALLFSWSDHQLWDLHLHTYTHIHFSLSLSLSLWAVAIETLIKLLNPLRCFSLLWFEWQELLTEHTYHWPLSKAL